MVLLSLDRGHAKGDHTLPSRTGKVDDLLAKDQTSSGELLLKGLTVQQLTRLSGYLDYIIMVEGAPTAFDKGRADLELLRYLVVE